MVGSVRNAKLSRDAQQTRIGEQVVDSMDPRLGSIARYAGKTMRKETRSTRTPWIAWVTLCTVITGGCVDQQSLTQEERAIEDRVDAVVSGVLFENELDEAASYNVHKDGFVVINFGKSVPFDKYSHVVDILRSNKAINGLRAEQEGREVCPMAGYRRVR